MNTFSALNPSSRRAIRIPYESPLICQLAGESSGSAATAVSVLDIQPTERETGPVLAAVVQADHSVRLSWTAHPTNAYAYIVYRAIAADGPYVVQASGVLDRFFVDNPVSGHYFYKVTALEPNFGETTASNVVSVTVP